MGYSEIMTKINDGGRVVIPVEYRKALGIDVGDEMLMFLEDEEIRLVPRRVTLKRAQQLVKRYAKSRSLSDELIQDRRASNE
ncbi:AbrB/MazE/SpoVT family DNA-binding domain-containing protein [Romeria aff. gracilis LEGE 07310]|uniref:AbrB/MazE/SpoVT family DNA-binding domain-containing protein n=2 Tax=Vasconcelosia TaxID=3366328 RepID=A0A8J7DQD2_9CYAN|nr:AbrB/MazE/SpoVT family DNA-binding domain-containing protein [Romeria aff. gracilis LEGE 07310]